MDGAWYKWAKIIDPTSPPDSSHPAYPPNLANSANPPTAGYKAKYDLTVAIEILYISGGYVYYNTGGDPGSGSGLRNEENMPYFPTMLTPPPKLKNVTMLMPGDIPGPASYVRPIQRYSDVAAYRNRNIYGANIQFGSVSEVLVLRPRFPICGFHTGPPHA